jgi:hypothetical protein
MSKLPINLQTFYCFVYIMNINTHSKWETLPQSKFPTNIHTAISPSSVAGPLILSDNHAEARPILPELDYSTRLYTYQQLQIVKIVNQRSLSRSQFLMMVFILFAFKVIMLFEAKSKVSYGPA